MEGGLFLFCPVIAGFVTGGSLRQKMLSANKQYYSSTYKRTCHSCRARGLLHKMRQRMLAISSDRETLRDQMMEVPADGDPNAVAISIARVSRA